MGGTPQRVFTFFKILIIIVFIICGFVCRLTDKSTVSLRQRSLSTMSFQQDLPCRSSGFITLIRAGTPQLTWPTKFANPKRTIPRSLFISTVIVTILYLLLNAVFLFAAPVEAMQGQVEVGLIAARYIFGEWGGNLMGLLIALLLVSSISSMAFLGPRVSQVMGEDTYILRSLARKSAGGTPLSPFGCSMASVHYLSLPILLNWLPNTPALPCRSLL